MRTYFINIYRNRLILSIENKFLSMLEKDDLGKFYKNCHFFWVTRLNISSFMYNSCYFMHTFLDIDQNKLIIFVINRFIITKRVDCLV